MFYLSYSHHNASKIITNFVRETTRTNQIEPDYEISKILKEI